MLDYHGNLVERRKISSLQVNMVESQTDQLNNIDTTSVISSVSRAINPSSLAQDIEKAFEAHKGASFSIREGTFVY